MYRQIFLLISLDGLRRDLTIWSPGLLSFFERSNTSTRPVVLGLLEEFYLPLGDSLKPITRAFVLAVIPGLEEEGAENFDRTLKLLSGLQRCVGTELFWKCVWSAIISGHAIGQAAINFLHKSPPLLPPNLSTMFSREHLGELDNIRNSHVALLPRVLYTLLSSQDILTVRGGLDLLLHMLPLDTVLFHSLSKSDILQLMKSAIGVVQRRELSLNRRLWSWLGGSGRKAAQLSLVIEEQSRDADESTASALTADDDEEREVLYLRYFGFDYLREALLRDMHCPPIAMVSQEEAIGTTTTRDGQFFHLSGSEQTALRQNPFRIFLALLDKWSVSSALTEGAILDVWRALERQLRGCSSLGTQGEQRKELLTTATMLFDAIEKGAMIRCFIREIKAELGAHPDGNGVHDSSVAATALLEFVLDHFEFKEDLSKSMHLPCLCTILLQLVQERLNCGPLDLPATDSVTHLLRVCAKLVICFSPQLFLLQGDADQQESLDSTGIDELYKKMSALYVSASPPLESDADVAILEQQGINCRTVAFHDLLLSKSTSLSLPDGCSSDLWVTATKVTTALLQRLPESRAMEAKLQWNPKPWLARCAQRLPPSANEKISLPELDALISAVTAAAGCNALSHDINLVLLADGTTDVAEAVYDALMGLLSANSPQVHTRAVTLFWSAEASIGLPAFFQSKLCAGLVSDDVSQRQSRLDAFGIIWRNSSDSLLVTPALEAPLTKVLDLLRSNDPSSRQSGETWLRRNVRSYTPIFELFLRSLMLVEKSGSSIRQHTVIAGPENTQIQSWSYSAAFDHNLLNFWLASMVAVAKCGGAGFVRAATSGHAGTSTLASDLTTTRAPATYMGIFFKTLLHFLKCEDRTPSSEKALRGQLNATTHSLCIDFLQLVIAKNGLSPSQLAELETCLLERLLVSIQDATPDRQHRLLLALHTTTITKISWQQKIAREYTQRRDNAIGSSEADSASVNSIVDGATTVSPHPLLLRTLRAGFTLETNRPALAHWTDFVLMTIPHYRHALTILLKPLCECLCDVVLSTSDGGELGWDVDEFVLLLNTLERVVLLCLDGDQPNAKPGLSERTASDDGGLPYPQRSESMNSITAPPPAALQPVSATHEKTGGAGDRSHSPAPRQHRDHASAGVLGYVSGIFGGDSSGTHAGSPSASTSSTHSSNLTLRRCVKTLHRLWSRMRGENSVDISEVDNRGRNDRIRSRCRRSFERLHHANSSVTTEVLIDCWHHSNSAEDEEAVFEILEVVSPGSQIVVTFLCDILAQRLPSPGTAKPNWTEDSIASPMTLLKSLEAFLVRLPSSAAAYSVWPVVIPLIKDLLANSAAHKTYLFAALRCFTVLGDKLLMTNPSSTSSANQSQQEDRRFRRDLSENYIKLFDLCVLIAGRSFDSTTWIGGVRASSTAATRRDRAGEDVDEKPSTPHVSSDAHASASTTRPVVEYLYASALPALRKFVPDADKVASCCSNAVYYIIAPPLRLKSNQTSFAHIDDSVLRLASEIARSVPGALRTIRPPLTDAFMDPRFFKMPPKTVKSKSWRSCLLPLYTVDRDRFFLGELVGRVSSSASANIFTNREAENILRSTNLRRLSFVLFSSSRDQFLPQLPAIQEKLVDMLRSNPPDLVAAEVYLLLRVLLMRFHSRHLTTLWPIIIAELVRLFELYSGADTGEEAPHTALPTQGSEGLQLLLQACKFVDVLLCTRVPEFQVHQWLFVNDAGLAEFEEEDVHGDSLFERLAGTINTQRAHSASNRSKASKDGPSESVSAAARVKDSVGHAMLRPLLAGTQKVSRAYDLLPFLTQSSKCSFEGTTDANSSLDVVAIEDDLLNDFFEGVEESISSNE